MTNIDMNLEAANDTDAKKSKSTKKNKNKTRRRVAKALAYFALVFTGLLVLAEPWLLVAVAALLLAISLWD
ncbi:hypothetical protein [Yinghuangia seranimata]|uniref:hypothetical protein n=1 Tax=Yinghuangia seranimata TaxID=408067 RepID=UPI00248C0730|nr:hypothetical protein [Yinghuangia seranimata]MDI2125049.1 hypothetical protein [Yinghuangia seranimata]